MVDEAELERNILAEIGAAESETALDVVRVAALGKKGSVSALMATLGRMAPDERKAKGAALNLLKDRVSPRRWQNAARPWRRGRSRRGSRRRRSTCRSRSAMRQC